MFKRCTVFGVYQASNGLIVEFTKYGNNKYAVLSAHKFEVFRFMSKPIEQNIKDFLQSLEFLSVYDFTLSKKEFLKKYKSEISNMHDKLSELGR